jgi:hypothetical protein
MPRCSWSDRRESADPEAWDLIFLIPNMAFTLINYALLKLVVVGRVLRFFPITLAPRRFG